MATAVALDSSPANVLRSMHGAIIDARLGYPDVLHVEIKDSAGETWQLATQDADRTPTDPREPVGQSVEDARIDEAELGADYSRRGPPGVWPGLADQQR